MPVSVFAVESDSAVIDSGVISVFPVTEEATEELVVEAGAEECVIISRIGPEPRAYDAGLNVVDCGEERAAFDPRRGWWAVDTGVTPVVVVLGERKGSRIGVIVF